jgi:adenosine deaminase
MREALLCGTPDADPGCRVTIRYQAEALRAFTPVQVFAMLVWSFEQCEADPRFVAINLVQPEDGHVPVRDYDLHMRMIEFLHGRHPRVNIALHAGELTLGQVPPEVLGTHVAKAIAQGHARRIGHGTDLAYHPRPSALMEEMKRKDVAVEISLSSSDVILGVRGDRHPLRAYVRAGVPVVIATDDEGVARSDLTNEYLRAVLEHGLGYRELKRISRDSLRYAFLEPEVKARLAERLEQGISAFEARGGEP